MVNYVCPIMVNRYSMSLHDSRHPVVETILKTPFISNSICLSKENNISVITGPNMVGKVLICVKLREL
ncbi:hypothetical protein [Buchnera aphidicola]|uniref:hypothetical protein n=1 Tax=Buchnera aphidicola TaxID=9 RepID=UPI0021CA9442|nr:hypothetical protein [Buchnera aphidicola]